MTYHYYTFGLNIKSALELPELLVADRDSIPDIQIIKGKTPSCLPNCQKKGIGYEVAPYEFLLNLPDIACFYVSNGDTIIIEPRARSVSDDIRLFLLGSCLGAILHQRKILAMHASAIVHEGQAVLFTGISGAGKSTTANTFRLKGYKMLTDDVCPIKFIAKKPYALSGYPQSKLWEDALEKMEIEYENLEQISSNKAKRKVPILESFDKKPAEIKALYILQIHDKNEVEIFDVNDAEKFLLIKAMTYRDYLLKDMGIQAYHFKNATLLANQIHIKWILRPLSSSVNKVIKIIEEDLESLKEFTHKE